MNRHSETLSRGAQDRARQDVDGSRRRTAPPIINSPTPSGKSFTEYDSLKLVLNGMMVAAFDRPDAPPAVREAIRRLKLCPLSLRAQKKPSKGYPCGTALCAFCAENATLSFAHRYVAKVEGIGGHQRNMSFLTLKMRHVPDDLLDGKALLNALEQALVAFALLRRRAAQYQPHIFRAGVFGVHPHWDSRGSAWDIHLHVVLRGRPMIDDVQWVRSQWRRLSGRNDGRATHWKRIKRTVEQAIAYLRPSLVSIFVDDRNKRLGDSWKFIAYRNAAQQPWVVNAYLRARRPVHISGRRGIRLVGSFGKLRSNI